MAVDGGGSGPPPIEPCLAEGTDEGTCTLSTDSNGDGVVNVLDILATLATFGSEC
eukprot:SAG31_NODE_378_length_16503_cov_28.830041_6_plen_55_part_00